MLGDRDAGCYSDDVDYRSNVSRAELHLFVVEQGRSGRRHIKLSALLLLKPLSSLRALTRRLS